MGNLNDQRASFPQGEQRTFVEAVQNIITVSEMANICGCSERAIRDWRREKFTMPLEAVHKLSAQSNVPIPSSITITPAYAHTSLAGKKGGLAIMQKYGRVPVDPSYRAAKWEEWWEQKGQYKKHPIYEPKPFRKPRKSTLLAECVGILMGDGGLSKYQLQVSLNRESDAEYILYVSKLLEELFGVQPSVYNSKTACVSNIVISRKELVTFLKTLGLLEGDKLRQGLDIPTWIKDNSTYAIACIRGLVDTDGSVFTHSYISKGKRYHYKKLSFTSASPPLIQSVFTILTELGFRPRISRGGRDVCLDSKADMERYFKLIGTSNPKHLKRYKSDVG